MKTFLRSLRGQISRPGSGYGNINDDLKLTTTMGTVLFSAKEETPLEVRVVVHTHRWGLQEFTIAREVLAHPIEGDVTHDAHAHVFALKRDISILFNTGGSETLIVIGKRPWTKMMKKLDKRIPEPVLDEAVDRFVEGLGL